MFVLDRFEGNIAVVERESEIFNVPRDLLPEGAKEGDCLTIEIKIDEKSNEHRKRIEEKAKRLWE